MPAVYHQTFKARYYECDALGHLKNISYLRWMQESAFAASAAVGYDFAQYHKIGQLWLVRESHVEHFAPIRYGDEVEVTTYVKDMRRFRSIRTYEMRNAASGERVAEATTDWVYLDTETLRPVTIPKTMQRAFFPEGVPQNSLSRKRYPQYPAPENALPELHKIVVWNDIDMMWHVNNANYLNYMDEVEKYALGEDNWTPQRFYQLGFRLHTEKQHSVYLQPAVQGDEIAISTWCANVESRSALRYYTIRRLRDGARLLQAMVRWGVRNIETDEVVPIPAGLYGC